MRLQQDLRGLLRHAMHDTDSCLKQLKNTSEELSCYLSPVKKKINQLATNLWRLFALVKFKQICDKRHIRRYLQYATS